MSVNTASQLQPVRATGWRRGLANLLSGETSAWFGSSRWWKHLLMWVGVVNVMMIVMMIATGKAAAQGDEGPPLLFMYGIFGGMFVAFGVMVIMQRVLVREKQAGTAAWVLSKPVTRTAFVVSRLVVNTIAILFTAVVTPGVILYISLGLLSDFGWLSPVGFAAALVMNALHVFYWITLALMLGTLLESSGGVIAIPIALYFTFWYLPSLIPAVFYISPITLTFSPAPEQFGALSVAFMTGAPVFSWLPLIATVVSCIAFIAVAIWRFNRQEF